MMNTVKTVFLTGFKLRQGRFRLYIRKNVFTKKSGQALEQAAQGSGGVTIPGGV